MSLNGLGHVLYIMKAYTEDGGSKSYKIAF